MAEAVIRPMERGDLPAVAAMLAALADHVRPGFKPLADVENLDRYGPTGLGLFAALIARRAERPVGLCLYTHMFSGWRGRPGIFIHDLYVEPSERGSGLGRDLLAAAIRQEVARGCAFVRLDVDKANEGAIAFYERLGFTIEDHDHSMVLEEGGWGAVLAGG